ncbi:protein RD3-like [Myxocyprinus asiaticus]|uniref:protein RD3-like n=1 Tax=Myxocyprinus asiaticus TaxID=70543 RepID=UPI00222380DC|nr:protein RD3-like [Myxocyprinus asiaticus]
MESRHHGPGSPAIPFFGLSKWPNTESVPAQGCMAPAGPGRMLLQELFWQLEQRAVQVQEEEFQYCISRGILPHRRPPAYPSLLALIPASERHQLERLCGRIPPSHTAIVLTRFHDLLAHNDISPWEMVGVFKHVLKDFLRRQEDKVQRRPLPSAPPAISSAPIAPIESGNRNHWAENASQSSPEESRKQREEIPTISSYVDKHLRAACPYSIHRDWSLPYFHPFTFEAYSTTL